MLPSSPSFGPSSMGRRALIGAAIASAPAVLGLSTEASAQTSTQASAQAAAPTSASPSARKKPRALPGGGDLGPNVLVFDPSTPGIQGRLDEVFRQQA